MCRPFAAGNQKKKKKTRTGGFLFSLYFLPRPLPFSSGLEKEVWLDWLGEVNVAAADT